MKQRDRDAYEEPKKTVWRVYQASHSKDFPGWLVVVCPFADCIGTVHDRPFLVHGWTWLRPDRMRVDRTGKTITIIGRSCPYCFRSSRVPKRSDIGAAPE